MILENEIIPTDKWAVFPGNIHDVLVQVALATEERERIVAALEDCLSEASTTVKPGLERLCMEAKASQVMEGV